MTTLDYTTFTGIFAIVIAALSVPMIKSLAQLRAVLQAAVFFAIISYPWDFFALTLGAWAHARDPGFRLFSVPLNDIVLLFLATFYSAALLSKPAGTPADAKPTPSPKIAASNAQMTSATDCRDASRS